MHFTINILRLSNWQTTKGNDANRATAGKQTHLGGLNERKQDGKSGGFQFLSLLHCDELTGLKKNKKKHNGFYKHWGEKKEEKKESSLNDMYSNELNCCQETVEHSCILCQCYNQLLSQSKNRKLSSLHVLLMRTRKVPVI